VARSRRGEILRHFRTLFDVGTVAVLSDGQLLDRFVAGRPEAAELAFAALLERHGPMVLRVCRRVLADPHEAEDAFQATFLVLVRRAGAIRRRDSVASWLHGVALRVARCARAAASRRRAHERRKGAEMVAQVEGGPTPDELGPALHQELGRLPGRFRDVAVLCYLEGRTHEEAAQRLGCPVGTVKSRLAGARLRLRRGLARRGLAPSAGLLSAALAAESAEAAAALPVVLSEATIQAVMRVAARQAAAGVAPAGVLTLTEGVLKAMLLNKLKLAAAATIALGLVGVGVVSAQQAATSTSTPAPAEPDRLREVERKLDRLIETLERSQPRYPTPEVHFVPPTVTSPAAVQPASTDVKPGQVSGVYARPLDVPEVHSSNGPSGGAAFTPAPKVAYAPISASAGTPSGPERPDGLVRRLDDLERRLERLERRLDDLDRAKGKSDQQVHSYQAK
jgi:RNA polymerase sigma factor (sigma-70 family)